jgi:hypothetical protein
MVVKHGRSLQESHFYPELKQLRSSSSGAKLGTDQYRISKTAQKRQSVSIWIQGIDYEFDFGKEINSMRVRGEGPEPVLGFH